MVNPHRLEQLLQDQPTLDIDKAFKRGWEMFKTNPGLFIAFALIYFIILGAGEVLLGDYSSIISILVGVPLGFGFYLVANQISRSESIEFKDFFEGFKFFVPLVLVSLLAGLLSIVGLVFLILPGIYLGVAYTFATLFSVYAGTEVWESLELSRKLITKVWWKFFGFILLLILINLAGLLALGLGLLVTIPLTYLSAYAAFEEMTGEYLQEASEIPSPDLSDSPEA